MKNKQEELKALAQSRTMTTLASESLHEKRPVAGVLWWTVK